MSIRSAPLFLSAVLAACKVPPLPQHSPTGDLPCAQDRSDASTPRDRVTQKNLEAALERLATSGATTELSKLEVQLKRTSTDAFEPLAAKDTELRPADVHDRARSAVGIVGKRYLCGKCDNWHLSTASGFFVSEDGVFVTNYHVIGGLSDTTFAVMTFDGNVHPVIEVLAADEAADVVLLRVEASGYSALPLRAGIRTGEIVHVLSHPDDAYWYFTSGAVARRSATRKRQGRTLEVLDITADFARGSSGAPVLDSTGAAVGVARATVSVYYVENREETTNLQMVFKRTIPIEVVIALTR